MKESDDFRQKVTKTMELLNKSKKLKEYLENEISQTDGYINTLAEDGVDVTQLRTTFGEVTYQFGRCKGLEDYKRVGDLLNNTRSHAHNLDMKIQEIIAVVDQTLQNIDKYSKLGLDMTNPLRVLVALRNKLRLKDHQTAMLYASEAWTQTETIRQKYEQINTYLDELNQRYEECKKLEMSTDEMQETIDKIKAHISGSEMNLAYKEMESLTKSLDEVQTEYLNTLIQDAYYEISLQPDINFSTVQEMLSQAEYALYNADFTTAVSLAKKTGPAIEGYQKSYQDTLNAVEKASSHIFHAKNLGVNVYQAENILSEANRMLMTSDFRMAEEYARQAEMELDVLREEIEWRERTGMENMYANVRNSLMALNSELQGDKAKGVDIEDAENLVEKIIEKMEEAKTMDDYKDIQEYISATYSSISRSRARHSRKENEKLEGRKELDDLSLRVRNFKNVCKVPKEIEKFMEKAFSAYDKGKTVDMKRDVGQIEQFFREMEMKEIDIDVNIKLLKEQVRIEDWVPVEIHLVNNSNAFIKDVSLKIEGAVDQKGFRKIPEIKGQDSVKKKMKVRFQNLGQNRLSFITKGLRAMDERGFKLKEKANVFVGAREEYFSEEYLEEESVDWGE